MNFRSTCCSLIGVLAVTFVSLPSLAQDGGELSLAEALTSGQAKLAFRYRYEHVDQDGFAENANASTLRLRLNYQTGKWKNWSGFAEFDYVGEVLVNDFNSLSGSSPDRDQYPVVADGKGTDLNQLYLDYDWSDVSKLRFGRQRILLDNQRFVGGVGWRQNEQTYDGLSFNYKGWSNTDFFYSYIATVRRIFGNEVPAGRHDTDTHLLNAKVQLSDNWSVTPYLYDIDDKDVAAFSTTTLGARLAGGVAVGDGKLNFIAELATQSDTANNPVSYDAQYINLSAMWALKSGWTFGLGWESLGGDQNTAGSSFRTPLATLHLFQGWADKFLSTPDEGINDLILTVKYKSGKWNFTGVYHDLSAEAGSQDWGTEIDLSAGRSLGDRYGLLLKAALYDADQHATDTNKFWIMLTASY